MGYPDTFEGFQITDHKNWSTFSRGQYKPKPMGDYDVDIKIIACGCCGSDVHTITAGWGEASKLPLVVGHEIVGRAVKVGSKVTEFKEGDRVGVGAQIWACLDCPQCKNDNENYCKKQVDTYNAYYEDGSFTQGGYANYIRAHEYFTFKIPDEIPTAEAAPMLCAGITVYSPLVRNGIGAGKKVGVVGLGGLGHSAVLFATALGAEVTVFSHSPRKKEDALKLGAKDFIVTTEKDWSKPLAFKFDMIISTANANADDFNMEDYFSTLVVNGKFVTVGLPEKGLPNMSAFAFMGNGCSIGGSHIGCRTEIKAMLKLAAEKKVSMWVEEIPLGEEGCKKAVERMYNNDNVKYRFTFVDYDKAFPEDWTGEKAE